MKAKKLLSILLCLVMMCTLLPMTALAEGETIITHVDIINAPTLVAGQTLSSFTAQSATPGITITRPDGYGGFQVWDVTGGSTAVVNGSTIIEAGRTYSIRVFVKVNDGYLFPYNGTVTSTINGSAASTGYVGGYDTSNHKYRSISLDVTVPAPPVAAVTGISIDPTSASVEKGKTQQFTATVSGTGDFNKNVAWAVSGAASTIDANGLLTVGAEESAATLTVIATAEGDTGKTASATVTVTEPAPEHSHSVTTILGQAPTCKNDGWMDHYQCSCGIFSDEGCSDAIDDLDAWKQGDGCIPSPGHPLTTNFDATHHWSECAAENCDDPDTAKSAPEAHYDTDPKDYECDFCFYDMRTKLTSVPVTMKGMQANATLGSIQFTLPAGCISTESRFATDLDPETYNGTLLPLSTPVEYGKEYWVVIQMTTDEGYVLPDPEPGYFTLNGVDAIAVMNLSAELADDGASDSSDEYAVLFKLPVLAESAHGHSYAYGDYKHDDTYHWQQCASANCNDPAGSITNKAKHKGGTATCLAKAKCSVCGEEYGKKLAHDYSEWVVVKEPTDTAYGKKERTCSMCKGVHMEYIPPLGQNPQTGDSSDVFGWSSLLAAAVAGFLCVVFQSKKKKED